MKQLIIAGTGHRPHKLGGYSEEMHNQLVKLCITVLRELKPIRVISGMALGFDIALAEAALDLEIPVIAAIPFEGQEARWFPISKARYYATIQRIKDAGGEIKIISPGGYSAQKMFLRDRWMVDHCTEVLALYNGDKEGGTYHTLKYAYSKGIPIRNIWDLWVS